MIKYAVWRFNEEIGTIAVEDDRLAYAGARPDILRIVVRNARRVFKNKSDAAILAALAKQTKNHIFTVVRVNDEDEA